MVPMDKNTGILPLASLTMQRLRLATNDDPLAQLAAVEYTIIE
jgi:hypothetical protein